jgi:hypothetical protein
VGFCGGKYLNLMIFKVRSHFQRLGSQFYGFSQRIVRVRIRAKKIAGRQN